MSKEADSKSPNEGDTFTEFTKKLLAVPKKEIDAEKAKHERNKELEKGKRGK
jgi:hypothetical protein